MYLNSFLACSNQEYQKRDRDERNTNVKPKTIRTCLMSTWIVVMFFYLSLAPARFGRVRRQPSGSLPQSTVTPFPPLASVVLFFLRSSPVSTAMMPIPSFFHSASSSSLYAILFFPFGLLVIVVRHFVPCPRGWIQSRDQITQARQRSPRLFHLQRLW